MGFSIAEVVRDNARRRPAATAVAIRDGWLYTGNIGRLSLKRMARETQGEQA